MPVGIANQDLDRAVRPARAAPDRNSPLLEMRDRIRLVRYDKSEVRRRIFRKRARVSALDDMKLLLRADREPRALVAKVRTRLALEPKGVAVEGDAAIEIRHE